MKFLSKVPYFALGLLSHVSQLYGVRVHLHDFELANIAGLISRAWLAEHGAAEAGRLLRESSQDRETEVGCGPQPLSRRPMASVDFRER